MTKVNGFKNDFKICPMCGSNKIENHGNRKWMCPDCGFDLYNNVATAVGLIIQDKNKNVLFEVRAKETCLTYKCRKFVVVQLKNTLQFDYNSLIILLNIISISFLWSSFPFISSSFSNSFSS